MADHIPSYRFSPLSTILLQLCGMLKTPFTLFLSAVTWVVFSPLSGYLSGASTTMTASVYFSTSALT